MIQLQFVATLQPHRLHKGENTLQACNLGRNRMCRTLAACCLAFSAFPAFAAAADLRRTAGVAFSGGDALVALAPCFNRQARNIATALRSV